MSDGNAFTLLVAEHDSGKRFDAFVASCLPACSRSLVAHLIARGDIRAQGAVRKPGYKLKCGDEICGIIPPPEPIPFGPEPIDLDILYEDRHLIVINKPAGLVVHPAPGHYTGTLVNGILHHCPGLEGIGGKIRPGIVHRLDKDTSGTLVVAKNVVAHEHLSLQFKSRQIKKIYLTLVQGEVHTEAGDISLPIGRHPVHRKKMSTVSKRGRDARTSWKLRERFHGATLLEVILGTGRTHQIRVHCSAIHHPIIGDDLYGPRGVGKHLPPDTARAIKAASRQMLHAWQLGFTHPVSQEAMLFESSVPPDMEEMILALRCEQ
ncbi:MAG: hypothetical protein B6245_07465 [Desulfobacteraceae bacterium 4572_88]|nr:MAG: hypothetical protein B6245_07465 [Desulfobacteraceae bacterium 4572_88]